MIVWAVTLHSAGSVTGAGVLSSLGAGFGLGIALAGAPGPVQAVIMTEAVGGGIGRGTRVQAGANLTFALLLLPLALGLSVAAPRGGVLRVLEVIGGGFILWLAIDGWRAPPQTDLPPRTTLPPVARGSLAVLLNPGVWLFLATAASSLLSAAVRQAGTAGALSAGAALTAGLILGDSAVVVFGALGVRRAGDRAALWVRRALACVLAGLGLWLVYSGVTP